MIQRSWFVVLGILALALVTGLVSASFAPSFEIMPMSMKNSSDAKPYADEAFWADAESLIERIEGQTVPTGSRLSDITGGYYRLIMENVSPEFHPLANNIAAFIYYTSKAGETYTSYHDYLKSVSKTTDGSEYYAVANLYYQQSVVFWDSIKELYPNMTVYILPAAGTPMPEEDTSASGGFVPKGLDIAVPMEMKKPDTNSADNTDKFITTTTRWFEDYVDKAQEPKVDALGKVTESAGKAFLSGEGVGWSDSTYMNLIGMNVAQDFYEKAGYITAFYYYISQAQERYQDYMDAKTFVSSVSDGREPYDAGKKYYDEAGRAIAYFEDIIPNGTNSTLPDYPQFNEVTSAMTSYGQLGVIGQEMGDLLSSGGSLFS